MVLEKDDIIEKKDEILKKKDKMMVWVERKISGNMENEDLLALSGLFILLLLIVWMGWVWALSYFLLFFVGITFLDWLRKKVRKYSKNGK